MYYLPNDCGWRWNRWERELFWPEFNHHQDGRWERDRWPVAISSNTQLKIDGWERQGTERHCASVQIPESKAECRVKGLQGPTHQ